MQQPDPVPRRLDRLALRGAPHAPALALRGETLDYAALDAAIGTLAAALARRAAPGDRVASWLPKTRTACLIALACARASLVHVPVNPLLKRGQVAHILADSGARLLVTQGARAALLEPWDLGDAAVVLEDALAGADALPASDGEPQALAALLYTSGSTGRPKGVMLSHANLWLGAVSVAHYLRLGADERTLAVLPLSFDAGLNQMLATWAAGGCVVPLDYLVPADVIKAVVRERITNLCGVPPLWVQLAGLDFGAGAASLRTLSCTGGRLPVPVIRMLRAALPDARLHLMYGLTEAFRALSLDPGLVDAHPDAVGRAIPFAEVSVRRADGSLATDGEPGELVQAGPLVAQGYWRDAERTAARFRDGAVWSGDTVMRGADGLHRFVGRDDEMLKISGNRVSPTEIEEAAVATGEAAEAVALGIADARTGHAIRLVVGGAGDDAALMARLRAALPTFQQPREIVRLAALPHGPNGKIDRAGVRREHGA